MTVTSEILRNKKKNLTLEEKRAIYEMLLQESTNEKLERGVIPTVALTFSVSAKSVSRIWHEAKHNVRELEPKLMKMVGRKKIEIDFQSIKVIPYHRRTNIRSLAIALGVPPSMVYRRIKDGHIRPHSNTLKPYQCNDNKKARLEFCLSMVNNSTISSKSMFVDMYDQIHIDEKWFYMSSMSQKCYLLLDESEPYRACKSKRFIPKLMFLAALTRPRIDATSKKEFDGKIGIWPFVYKEPAKRNNKNRRAGTLETKPILSITKDVIRSCLIDKMLSAIKEKWPNFCSKTIFIQQDNAKPHLQVNDPDFVESARKDGFNIQLHCQPANSPDMNVLDLGFFRANFNTKRLHQ